MHNNITIAIPKFAATVILLRKRNKIIEDSDFEVLMIKRSENMKFVGGFHAFPGGKVEEEDYGEENLKKCKGLNIEQAYNIPVFNQVKFLTISFSDEIILKGFLIHSRKRRIFFILMGSAILIYHVKIFTGA